MSTVSRAGIGRDLVAISGGMAAASLAVLVCLGAVHAASASGLAGPDPGSCGAVAKLDDAANGVIRATQSDDDSSIRPFVFDASLPVIITHRWPGSIIEQLKVIIPVTDHVAHGGKASDAFDVVTPTPFGPYILCAVMDIMSILSASTFTGTLPIACTASLWNNTPFSRQIFPISATGCTTPISLLAYMMLTRMVLSVMDSRSMSRSIRPSAITGRYVTR